VRWNELGTMFAVASGSAVDVYTVVRSSMGRRDSLCAHLTQEMVIMHSITHPARIQDVILAQHPSASEQTVLLVAAEDKKVAVYDLPPRASTFADADSDDAVEDATASNGPAPRIFAELVGHVNRWDLSALYSTARTNGRTA
jgi:hypothetical protein